MLSYFIPLSSRLEVGANGDFITNEVEAGLGIALVAWTPDGFHTIKLRLEPAPGYIAIGSLKSRKLMDWEQTFVEEFENTGFS